MRFALRASGCRVLGLRVQGLGLAQHLGQEGFRSALWSQGSGLKVV